MFYCDTHGEQPATYGGVRQCRACKRIGDNLNKQSRKLFWTQRYPLTKNLRRYDEIHHCREEKIRGFVLKQVEKHVPKTKAGKPRGLLSRMQDSNYSLKQDILFRLELACCKPMYDFDHDKLHANLRREAKVNGR